MPETKYQFGIIIPSFNDSRILHSIISVRAADPHCLTRIYIIDGLSNRELLSDIRPLLRAHDVLISEADSGIFDALNKGLDRVNEPYLGWLGSDDFYPAELTFDDLHSAFEVNALDVILMDTVFVDGFEAKRRTIASAPTKGNYRIGLLVPHFSSFWRRTRIGDIRFDIRYKSAADQGFFLNLISEGPLKYKIDNRVGLIARLGGASTGGVRRILRANLATFALYRREMWALTALLAVMSKLTRKIYWSWTVSPYPMVDEMSETILKLARERFPPQ